MSQAPLRKQSRWSLWIPLGKSPDSHGTRCRRPRVAGHITGGFTGGFLPDMNDVHVSLPLSLYIYIYIYTYVWSDIIWSIYVFLILKTSAHLPIGREKKTIDDWTVLDLAVAPWRFGCAISGVTNGTMAVVDGLVWENLHRKPMELLPWNELGFPVKIFPSSKSMMWGFPSSKPWFILHL
jgi:hypothetical protein